MKFENMPISNLSNMLKHAQTMGHSVVAIAVRDIHDGLQLQSKLPNVCQALSGEKFYTKYGFSIPEIIGPNPSSTTIFVYRLSKI